MYAFVLRSWRSHFALQYGSREPYSHIKDRTTVCYRCIGGAPCRDCGASC